MQTAQQRTEVDTSLFPVVVMNLDECPSVQRALEIVDEHLRGAVPFVLIADGSRGLRLSLDAAARRASADFLRDNKDRMRAMCVGFCTVSASRFVRGAVMAVNWISPMPVPNAVLPSRTEAVAWARRMLNERGSL